MGLLLVAAGVGLSIFSLYLLDRTMGPGVWLLVLGLVFLALSGRDCVRVYRQHLEYTLGPLAWIKVVKLADIEDLDVEKGRVVILLKAAKKPITFGRLLLKRDEFDPFVAALENVLAGDVPRDEERDAQSIQQAGSRPGSQIREQASKPTNSLVILGLVINILICVIFVSYAEADKDFLMGAVSVLGAFIALSILGVALMHTDQFKLGSVLALIGFAAFVPAGLIGVMGVKRARDARIRAEAISS